jgi:hypothetical protein
MKPRLLAVWLLAFGLLPTALWAQEAASPGPSPGDAAAAAKKKESATKSIDAPASAGGAQQKQETPPPPVSGVAPRPSGPSSEPGQMTLELKYTLDRTWIQGNTNRSFLYGCTRKQVLAAGALTPHSCKSINNAGEISFLDNLPFGDHFRFETSFVTRYTDNPRVDPERTSLQRGYLRISGKDLEATLGDSLVNYSRFSFSQNIKGLHFWQNWSEKIKLTGTIGFFADRWGSLYRSADYFRDITSTTAFNPAAPPKPYTRFVTGARLEGKLGRSGWLAFNFSHGRDLLQTLPPALITCIDTATLTRTVRTIGTGCLSTELEDARARLPISEATNNDVFSVDTKFDVRPLRLNVLGEIAYSRTAGGTPPSGATPASFACASQPPLVGGAVLDARCFSDRVGDPAFRFETTQKLGKLSWRSDFSRFQPNFSSANARQIRDLQDFNVRGDYQFVRQFTLAASWRRSNDNLNGDRNFTSIVRAPEVRLIFREMPFYKKLALEVGYRERNLDTAGNPQVTCLDTSVAPAVTTQRPARTGCLIGELIQSTEQRIRSTRIPFVSLSLPVADTLLSFDYEHRYDKDSVTRQNSTNTDRFAVGFRGNYTFNSWDVIPSFRFEVERLDKRLPNNPSATLTDPLLLFPFDFFGAHDSNRSFNAGLQVEAPHYFRFEAIYREFNSVALSPLDLGTSFGTLPAGCDLAARRCYLNQGFKRPNWHAALTYKIQNDENKLITVFFERSNNFFALVDPTLPDTKSFRETVLGGTLLFRFHR